jgi:superoxide dismutase, Cu-Zn family
MPTTRRKMLGLAATGVTVAVLGTVAFGGQASAHDASFRATLRDPSGAAVGTVKLRISSHATEVTVKLRPSQYVTPRDAFHGFHIHANNDDSNGVGCIADPALPSSTWFVSADGHLSDRPGQIHGGHTGDLPSPLVLADGSARLRFSTDRIDPAQVRGRVVVLHAGADNFGNVPAGSEPNQYTPNSPGAGSLTSRTGNAGDRVACGSIHRSF